VSRRLLFFVASLVVLCAASAYGADSLPQLVTRVYPKDGKPMLEISGTAPDASDWLAVTFFRPGERDSTYEGERTVYSVKGTFLLPVPVPGAYVNGSYEVGLWQRKLSDNGLSSRPVGLKAQGAGKVAGGAEKLRLADSLAELATEVGTRDGQRVLTVSGTARDNRWLDITFRRAAGQGVAGDSVKVLLYLTKGDFRLTVAVPAGYEAGTYAANLWVRFAQERRSFRLDGALAVSSGQVRQ
jgi:hypothetical protein